MPAPKFKPCLIDACEGNSSYHAQGSKGYCNLHLNRLRRHGHPLLGRTPEGEPVRYLEEVVLPYEGDECLLWPYATNPSGYGQLLYDGKVRLVSRIVCERHRGPAPTPEHEAAHSCGKGHLACVAKTHLSWKSPLENSGDKIGHGTVQRGDASRVAKLRSEQVLEIRRLKGILTAPEIAAKFGVGVTHVYNIQSRRTWSHL